MEIVLRIMSRFSADGKTKQIMTRVIFRRDTTIKYNNFWIKTASWLLFLKLLDIFELRLLTGGWRGNGLAVGVSSLNKVINLLFLPVLQGFEVIRVEDVKNVQEKKPNFINIS